MSNTIFICMVQIEDKATGEWINADVHTKKTREGIQKIVDLESRDTTCGGMVSWGNRARRLWVRTAEVSAEEFIRLPN